MRLGRKWAWAFTRFNDKQIGRPQQRRFQYVTICYSPYTFRKNSVSRIDINYNYHSSGLRYPNTVTGAIAEIPTRCRSSKNASRFSRIRLRASHDLLVTSGSYVIQTVLQMRFQNSNRQRLFQECGSFFLYTSARNFSRSKTSSGGLRNYEMRYAIACPI